MRDQEHELQKRCVNWFRYAFPRKVIFAVPNGGQRNVKVAAKLKREGVMSGVSDLILLHNKSAHFIEMKNGNGKQQDSQKEFQKCVENEGMKYYLCRSFEDFEETVKTILV